MERRGLSPVVGFVMLVGIVAIGAMSLFVAGMALAEATQSNAEQEQLERSMTQFADTANEIASSEVDSGEFQISGTDDGTAVASEDAGHLEMWVENDTSRQTLLDSDLGAYRYRTDDNQEVVYQGGGVWRTSDNGPAQVVRTPPFDYRNGNDPTLTYEFVRMAGSNEEIGAVAGNLDQVNRSNIYPGPRDPNPLQDGSVYLQIESDYCEGWEQFFQDRTDSAVQESCSASGKTSTGEIRVLFSVPFEFGGLDSAEVSASRYTGGSIDTTVQDDWREPGPVTSPSADSLIESRVSQCKGPESDCDPITDPVNDGGTYYADEMTAGEDYSFDTSNGDIEVVVDGKVNPDSIDITGPGNVTIFANGHVFPTPGGNYGHVGEHADQFRILVHSDYDVGSSAGGGGRGGGDVNIEAFIYAPDSKVTIGPGRTDYKGGIIAEEVFAHSKSVDFNNDPDVIDVEFSYGQGGEPFYYLHVSKTTLEVTD